MIPNAFEWIPLDEKELERVNILKPNQKMWNIVIIFRTAKDNIWQYKDEVKPYHIRKFNLTHYMILDLEKKTQQPWEN